MRSLAPAFLFVLCLAGASHAEDYDSPRTDRVIYSDLNTESASGAKTLFDRISAASRRVCGSDDVFESRRFDQQKSYDQCRAAAVEQAVRAINKPYLTAYAHGETLPVAVAQH